MKRKDEAAQRQATETQAQKSVERTHWTIDTSSGSSSVASSLPCPKFAVEYDLSTSTSAIVARQSYQNQSQNQDAERVTSPVAGKGGNGTKQA
jgi:hypothetical protein